MEDNSGFQIQDQAPHFYESKVSIFMAPFVQSVVQAAVRQGDRVLDVASGTGFAARAASVIAGSEGYVVGSDVNPEMVAMARSVPHEENPKIEWCQASALALPFDDDDFDAVICQQGIQFFPDIPAGLREMARVTKKGGRLAATVWGPRAQSPYLDAVFGMLGEHCDGAGLGAYAEGGEIEVRGWFETANFGRVHVETVEAVVQMPPVSDYVLDHLKAQPLPALGNFVTLSLQDQEGLLQSVDQQLDRYRTKSGFDIPFRSFLATAIL